MSNRTKKPLYAERGQAIILIVFSIVGLIGMAALAIDGGRMLLERRNVQNAADAAALGAALARVRDPQGAWAERGYAIAEQNGYGTDSLERSVLIYSPPITGDHVDDIEYIQVIITSRVDTYFGVVIGFRSSTVSAEAISRTKAPELKELLDGNAVVSLRQTSECVDINDLAFWVHGESTLNITGGNLFVNSNNPDCALMQSGSGSIRMQDDDAQIKVVGGAQIKKPQLVTPFPPFVNSAPYPYPPPFFMPALGCHRQAELSADGLTMSSGSWDSPDPFPPPTVRYLASGVYCISQANFEPSSDEVLEGKEVIIIVETGKLKLSGEHDVALSAPADGDFAGLLFYVPMDNDTPVVLAGGMETHIHGTILAPGAQVRINGNESRYGFHSQIIGYSILSDGTDNIRITYLDEENYDAYTMPEVQLIK